MGWFDTVVHYDCHEIFGFIAMQQMKFNVVLRRTIPVMIALAASAAMQAFAGSITNAPRPDPLLDGDQKSACTDLMAGADYAGGTDADGNPVAPADVAAGRVPVPDQVAVPLHGRTRGAHAYVGIDGRKLDPLVNPPACNRQLPR